MLDLNETRTHKETEDDLEMTLINKMLRSSPSKFGFFGLQSLIFGSRLKFGGPVAAALSSRTGFRNIFECSLLMF